MFPQSSIKRLRFAFAAMAGLTLLALIVGCISFIFSHSAQKRFLDETTPLLIDIEQLSKVAIRFASTSRQLETIDSRARLTNALRRYRVQSDRLQAELLKMADYQAQARFVRDLKDVVQKLDAHEETYATILSAKIDAMGKLTAVRREIHAEAGVLQDRLAPLFLEASLSLIDKAQPPVQQRQPPGDPIREALNEVQLFTDIGFAAERFLHAVGQGQADRSASLTTTSRETLAPEFRRLAQLTFKLGNRDKRRLIARSLKIFEAKALGDGGVTQQVDELVDLADQLDGLSRQRTILLARMTDLIDKIVGDVRGQFLDGARAAETRSLIAVLTLVAFSMVALAAVVWIGSRLINRDIAQRLDRLATSTVALAAGDLDVPIDQSGKDELADMARAAETFRRNARELRRTEAELADQLVEVQHANQQLVRANRELERSNDELDQFAHIASHDLKEPLRAVYNHARFLLEDYQDKLDDDGERRLNRLIQLSRRMEKLIADLHYFSRLGRGDQALDVLDLNQVVANVEASLREMLMARKARISVPAPLPSIAGHPAHISTLFQNLISNGAKYNDADEKVIEVGRVADPDPEAPDVETLYVRDNGIGIEPLFKDDVFRLFKRLNSEKAYGEGSGAGLTFAKKIVENHGGKIWFESTPGKGTSFYFTLKRAA